MTLSSFMDLVETMLAEGGEVLTPTSEKRLRAALEEVAVTVPPRPSLPPASSQHYGAGQQP